MQAPREAERIAEWLLAQLAEGGDVRQCDYLLNSAPLSSGIVAFTPANATTCSTVRRCWSILPALLLPSFQLLNMRFVVSYLQVQLPAQQCVACPQ
jgi:hypothetical protein